jgi:hypothetical protein
MAVTLIGVVAVRFCLGVFFRAHYISPLLASSSDPFNNTGLGAKQPSAPAGRTGSSGWAPGTVAI